MLEFFLLLIGITIAAALLSYGAEEVAERYGAGFTGSIVLGLITTLPEYLFVIFACVKGQYDNAVGSAVGSCILLATLGYGTVLLLATSRFARNRVERVHLTRSTRIDAIYLFITTFVAFGLAWEGHGLDVKDGIIMAILFLLYMAQHGHTAIKESRAAAENEDAKPVALWRAGVLLAIGGAAIFVMSGPFVDAMSNVALKWGVSAVFVFAVIGPIASEMPEKIAAYITVGRNARLAEISVCNFIGSRVNHTTLLLATIPIVAAFQGRGNVEGVINPLFYIMVALTIPATYSLATRRPNKWHGLVFTVCYGLFLWAAFHFNIQIGHG